jgi:cardiolipin-specific phospholipase
LADDLPTSIKVDRKKKPILLFIDMTEIKQDTILSLPAVIPPTSHLNFLRTWWHRSDKTSEVAETRLLNHYITKNVVARVDHVDIGGENRLINTLVVEKANDQALNGGEVQHGPTSGPVADKKALVMCHGYGAGTFTNTAIC